jgi:hypothetical protein
MTLSELLQMRLLSDLAEMVSVIIVFRSINIDIYTVPDMST